MRTVEVVCRNRHAPAPMERVAERDAYRCPECGNENSRAFLFQRWGALLRLARRDER